MSCEHEFITRRENSLSDIRKLFFIQTATFLLRVKRLEDKSFNIIKLLSFMYWRLAAAKEINEAIPAGKLANKFSEMNSSVNK